jgi:hypothetical protein
VVGLRIRYHVSVREKMVVDPPAKTMMSREGQVDAMVKQHCCLALQLTIDTLRTPFLLPLYLRHPLFKISFLTPGFCLSNCTGR